MAGPFIVPREDLAGREVTDTDRLIEAADRLTEAKRAWAEAFLRFKMGRPPAGQKVVTDNQAKAMADVEVSVTRAEMDWELAKRGIYRAVEPGPRADQARADQR